MCVRGLFQLWSSKVRVTWPLGQMDFIGSLSFLCKKQVFIWLPCWVCFFFSWPRLPETDDRSGDDYSSHVSFPVAACLCPHPPSFSPAFLRCSCSLPDGLAFQWPWWPVKAGAASGGEKRHWILGHWRDTNSGGWRQGTWITFQEKVQWTFCIMFRGSSLSDMFIVFVYLINFINCLI